MHEIMSSPRLFLDRPAGAMKIQETLRCKGDPNISARHPTTFEVTKEDHLYSRGDCIIGIGADKGAVDLSHLFMKMLTRVDAVLVTSLYCQDLTVIVTSRGSSAMTLDHPTDLVWRRSNFVCGRTVGIGSDYAAKDLPRALISLLCNGEELVVEMTVIVEDLERFSSRVS